MNIGFQTLCKCSIMLLVFWLGACEVPSPPTIESSSSTAQITEKKTSLILVSAYTMPASEGRLSEKFAFTSNHRMWSRGSSDSKSNQMMFSDNFGKSWTFVDLPNRSSAPGSVLFIDQRNGWAMDAFEALSTTDGGMTWNETPLPSNHKMAELNAIEFTDPKRGYVAGSTSYLERGFGILHLGIEIICTQNGGKTWSICYKDHVNDKVRKMVSLGNLTMALVDQKTLLMTSDGGKTWTQKHWEFPATDIEAVADGVLWTTGEDGFLRSSSDLGDTWKIVSLPKPESREFRWTSISFDTKGLGAAVGSDGAIAFTTDMGRSWELRSKEKSNENLDLWTVRVQKPYIAILTKNTLYVFRVDGD